MASKQRKLRKLRAKLKREERLAKLGATFQLSESGKAAAGSTTHYVQRGMGGQYAAGTTKHCAHSAKKLFNIGKAEVWAGASIDIKWSMRPWKLLLCCAGADMAPAPELTVSKGAQPYFGTSLQSAGIPYVALEWPDGGTPCFTRKHWQALVDGIAKVNGSVGVYCLGGHGRTGTAIAILGCLSGAIPENEDPVQWVRDHYCDQAVEADKQVAYINKITGRDSRAFGSDPTLSPYWDQDYDDDPYTTYLYGYRGGKLTAAAKKAIDNPREATDANTGCKYTAPPSPPPLTSTAGGVTGVPILNGAGDVIGYDYSGTRVTETHAGKPHSARKADSGADVTGPQPWQKWKQEK